MANKLTLNEPIAIAALKYVTIVEANGINDTKKEFDLVLELYAEGGMKHPNEIPFFVSDGACDRLRVVEAPETTLGLIVLDRVTADEIPEVATAFTTSMGLYAQSGGDLNPVLNFLQSISLLPAGVAG